jgi:hypothetical protein
MKLRIWWIPQIPGKPFTREVETLVEAKVLLEVLADYDKFQLDNNIKPDYSNIGGLCYFDENEQEWLDWHPSDDPEFEAAIGKITDEYEFAESIDEVRLEDLRVVEANRWK